MAKYYTTLQSGYFAVRKLEGDKDTFVALTPDYFLAEEKCRALNGLKEGRERKVDNREEASDASL